MSHPRVHIPSVAGPWEPLFSPVRYGNYINDHCLVRADDGSWHLFGITGFDSDPVHERYFVHARSDKLIGAGGMTEVGKVLDEGQKAWAPCVVPHAGAHYMIYGPSPTRLAVAVDFREWWPHPIELVGAPVFAAHRDHAVIRYRDDSWLMYVTGLCKGRSSIACFVSNDLLQWRFVQFALTSSGNAPLNPPWGAFESPFVVRRDGVYYLFTTYTDSSRETYHQTFVFASGNPFDFGDYTGDNHDDMVIATLRAHAGEVVHDEGAGAWYLTSAGWRGAGAHTEGGASIAPLTWGS